MKRVELVKNLELLAPALATSGLVPVFGCFMFTKGSIVAFNGDSLAIKAPFANEVVFAVDGKTLLGLLNNTKSDTLNLTREKEEIRVKAGKSIFKLPFFPESEFLFEEPNEKWNNSVSCDGNFLEGVDVCLTTACRDQSMPAIMGICINLDENNLYSCDGDAISRVKIAGKVKGKGSFTVPNSFFDALLKIAQSTEAVDGKIELTSNWAKATLSNGFTIYGRVIADAKLDHEDLIDKTMGSDAEFFDVPDDFDDALGRARVIADPESKPTILTVSDGKLSMLTESSLGEARDDGMTLKGHSDIEVAVHASLVQRSLLLCDQIAVLERCTAYQKGKQILQVVSNMGE